MPVVKTEQAYEQDYRKSFLDDIKKVDDEKDKWVDHPAHYNGHKIKTSKGEFEYETIDYLSSTANRLSSYGLPADAVYSICCAVKYIERCGSKPGDYGKDQKAKAKEDCLKAVWYLNKAASLLS